MDFIISNGINFHPPLIINFAVIFAKPTRHPFSASDLTLSSLENELKLIASDENHSLCNEERQTNTAGLLKTQAISHCSVLTCKTSFR